MFNVSKKYWYKVDVLNENPLTKFLSLSEFRNTKISFLLYVCLALLPIITTPDKSSKPNKKRLKKKPIDIQKKLEDRRLVQLVRTSVFLNYLEISRV